MKILIRLPNWLGDVVMSTAFINAVRQLYPDGSIDVIIKKELGGIASLILGLNKIHLFSKHEYNGLGGVYRFGKTLRAERYDIFFNLPHSLSSFVLAWASGAKRRIGFNKEGGLFLLTRSFNKPANLHRVDEYVYLLEQFEGKTISERQVNLKLDKFTDTKDTVIINFNSEASSRRMPLKKGRDIINTLTNTFKDITFAFVGSPKEAGFIDDLLIGLDNPDRLQNIAGKTNLKDLAETMANSKAVLTTDSGPAHLANAVGAPTVVLFGAGDETNTAPYNKQNLQVIRYGKLECEPCVRNTCELYGVPRCMEMLDEIKIIKALSLHLNHA
ncbi:glycosyltransferase family 9 protein [Mucilaginibacter sp. RB4R14]|uniref:glycosyltransferase family 9 protein n=1 Tax=Mucilaginibacter aurantiaciroseus TaxID=2949308 RepID=UPI0020916816|nr:glycosyltransferase family 9 protein [Mucilaginibacter aurantiaciroseus]MCO5935974.1 glycosyltransferase family 9 protein [Mucilaginibacter aurantiaciroseus]